ncbi:hypothetical protein F511_17511 [Dorcoceras hygrometricum]|uniref:Uncharacterized protein n=1 Tax=Dorcoceras hygrometricum TaxID=472368 RepID=A0A2Z7CUR8_9LAMI|nr:hypothetical protein F511_17511 [Dorcoceras hygrometricum]
MAFKGRKRSRLIRCMEGPFRILARARDLYFQNTSSGVHLFSGGGAMSCPSPQIKSLSRNISLTSTISSRSSSSGGHSIRSIPMIRRAKAAPVPRSRSVPIGRIDEDKCCHFGVDNEPEVVYPKSKQKLRG